MLKIIISPAKKMKEDTDGLSIRDLPEFLSQTEVLLSRLQSMSYSELKALWKCNDQIASQNFERIKHMDLYHGLTPAVLAYDGIQYQYMAPNVFTNSEFEYIQDHLRILSGFYGVLRPFDGVSPYRLEMQAKLNVENAVNLYEFWGDKIAESVLHNTKFVINLASKEYSQCVSRYLPCDIQFITCVFGELKQGKVIEKGTMCKMARGEMVRFMAENQVTEPQEIKAFQRLNYSFSDAHSDEHTYVFLKT